MKEAAVRSLGEASPVASAEGASQQLAVVRSLLDSLHAEGIVYCHWKSNEHVAPALEGLTDLDMLVDRRRHLDLSQLLATHGFKAFRATPLRTYPGVEDFLGFDPRTGRLAHLHLHHQLTLGQPYLKGYRLPWEQRILDTRVFDPQSAIFVADPNIELLLLLVRAALKRRMRDALPVRVGRRGSDARQDHQRELRWLLDRSDPDAVRAFAIDLLGPGVEETLTALLSDPFAPGAEREWGRAARRAVERHRTYGRLPAQLRCSLRELQRVAGVCNRDLFRQPVPLRRTSPRGGTVVAFLGSDGAGKSTLLKDSVAWLGGKLDVAPIYFGSGDGPASLYRWPLKLLRRGVEAFSRKRGPMGGASPPTPGRRPGSVRSLALLPWALTLSLEKRGKLRRMIRARNRGMIVICDRFPQAQFPGFNDGPLLHHLADSPWRVCRALSAWEARPYRDAAFDGPDLVIKLVASPDVALGRRPEMTFAELHRRIHAVRTAAFQPPTTVVDLDSDERLETVVLRARQVIWDAV